MSTLKAPYATVPQALRANLTNQEFIQIVTEAEQLRAINADLLAALEQLNIWMTSGVKVDGKHPDIAHQWIKTAIARAKGQS